MISRATSFGVGLILIGLGAFAVLGNDDRPLCINGHPAARRPNVIYGGLPPKSGYERDHIVPLCLGGPDTADNVHYQLLHDAEIKDEIERQVCRAVCAGTWQGGLEAARAFFRERKW